MSKGPGRQPPNHAQTMLASEATIREETTQQLVEAITQDQFVLFGQQMVPVGGNRDSRPYIEVLVRYLEEEKNLLPPGGFFDVLDSLNLMSVLDRWVLSRVVRSLVGQHQAHGHWNVPRYSINLSADSLYAHEFGRLVCEYFKKYRIPRNQLRFEIDEADAHVHLAELERLAAAIAPAGGSLTITSYTGTLLLPAALKKLGVTSVKIDADYLTGAKSGAAPAGQKLLPRTCKELGFEITAQFVEQRDTLELLSKLGIDFAQGFAISKPGPLASLTAARAAGAR